MVYETEWENWPYQHKTAFQNFFYCNFSVLDISFIKGSLQRKMTGLGLYCSIGNGHWFGDILLSLAATGV